MARFFKKTIELGGHVTTIWAFVPAAIQTSATAALTAVTGYFGYQELGLARAIFLATGVMAFGMTVTFLWLRMSQILGIYQKLSLVGIGIPNFALDNLARPTIVTGFNLQCLLRNDSQQLLFYQLKRVRHVMEQRVAPTEKVDDNIVVIAPNGGTQVINFATIENIPFASRKELKMSGSMDLEVVYGPSKDELKFRFRYAANIYAVLAKTPDGKNHQLISANSITAFEHSRV